MSARVLVLSALIIAFVVFGACTGPAARAAESAPAHPGACIWEAIPQTRREEMVRAYPNHPNVPFAGWFEDEELTPAFKSCGLVYDPQSSDWSADLDFMSYGLMRMSADVLYRRRGLTEARLAYAWRAVPADARAALAREGESPMVLPIPLKVEAFHRTVRTCAAALGIPKDDVADLLELTRYLVSGLEIGALSV